MWNVFDIVVHVGLGLVEPLRVAGNMVALAAAAIVLSGRAREHADHVLGIGALLVVLFNLGESILHGFLLPSLIFIAVSVFLLLRWAQIEWLKAHPAKSDDADTPIYLKWWVSIPVTIVLVRAYDTRRALHAKPGRRNDVRRCVGGG